MSAFRLYLQKGKGNEKAYCICNTLFLTSVDNQVDSTGRIYIYAYLACFCGIAHCLKNENYTTDFLFRF